MNLLAEGVESLRLACSIVLLLPLVGVALLGRRRVTLIATWLAVATVVAWLRFVTWWPLDAGGAIHIVGGVALMGAAAWALTTDNLAAEVGAVALAATLATWTWVPCVGRHLGDVLNSARAAPWAQLPQTALYLTGLFLPLVLLGAATIAWPDLGDRLDDHRLRRVGLGALMLIGALVATTVLDDVAGELARRSSF